MFIHVLAEPTLILLVYALALSAHTTSLSAIMRYHQDLGPIGLVVNPAVWMILLGLVLVTLAEAGRLPFDSPGTHLELTMVGKAIHLEYAGTHLALLEWAESMRLTFFLTLLLNLFFPYLLASPETGTTIKVILVVLYPFKLFVLILLLALWEMTRVRLRLRALGEPAVMALVFALVSIFITVLSRYLL
jgi:formate hydrogenlyase subunit 4